MTANQGTILYLSKTDQEKVNLAAAIRLIAKKGMEIDPHTKQPFPAYTPEDFGHVQAEIANDREQFRALQSRSLEELRMELAKAKGISYTPSPASAIDGRTY